MSTLLESTPSPAEGADAEEVLAMLGRQLGESATVGAVFGTPIIAGERTVVPVARVSYGFGGGKGAQAAPKNVGRLALEASEGSPLSPAAGVGMGGGGGLRVEPLAVVEITPRRVRIQPIVDVNRLIGRVFTSVFSFVIAALVIRMFLETRMLAAAPRRRLILAGLPPFAARLRARLAG